MSNSVNLVATKFVSATGEETFGFRMYDNYGDVYDNLAESLITDEIELLEYAKNADYREVRDMLDSVVENETGMNINGVWYDWDEIKANLEE